MTKCRRNEIMGIGDERLLQNYVDSCSCENCCKTAWIDALLFGEKTRLYNILFNSQQRTITTDNTGDFQQ